MSPFWSWVVIALACAACYVVAAGVGFGLDWIEDRRRSRFGLPPLDSDSRVRR